MFAVRWQYCPAQFVLCRGEGLDFPFLLLFSSPLAR